jgi:hypothetical protein
VYDHATGDFRASRSGARKLTVFLVQTVLRGQTFPTVKKVDDDRHLGLLVPESTFFI